MSFDLGNTFSVKVNELDSSNSAQVALNTIQAFQQEVKRVENSGNFKHNPHGQALNNMLDKMFNR